MQAAYHQHKNNNNKINELKENNTKTRKDKLPVVWRVSMHCSFLIVLGIEIKFLNIF